ncbi:glucose dehydrogenase [FAD, quinone]-like [Belonocnema kinseyi]|uniref:glucose dehydrogenase [FAD, quinone]-like n=1 Tax=Belonocnema kinseyi TaxID=2817044 RepID=UPI00143D94F2|nr:glucose dehydrogenase [FAD, quinone]-like [Belonocnema kinseyi]
MNLALDVPERQQQTKSSSSERKGIEKLPPITAKITKSCDSTFRVHQIKHQQTKIEPKVYDFIVVGAGSAGCVVANRLSEIEEWNVLLLEAGREEPVAAGIPGFYSQLEKTAIDWNYTTQPEEESCLINKGCRMTSGKVMGGTSALNVMMYIRGNKHDYDNLEKMGNPGWSYDEILPYFIKSEDNKDPEIVKHNPGYHGTGGYLTVSNTPILSPSGKIMEEAFNELGHPTIDVNGASQLGIAYSQLTIDNGVRKSTNAAFIRPIRGTRPNLIVKNEIYVTRILIDPFSKKARGVKYTSTKTGISEIVMAKKEVIVSAGAINSPRLLMVSGVGPAGELKKHGIKVIKNLSVGKNLQDHLSTDRVFGIRKNSITDDNIDECKDTFEKFSYYAKRQRGIFSTATPAFITGFLRTEYEKNTNVPDTQFMFALNDQNPNKFYFVVTSLTPKSRGFIKLNATNPVWGSPLVYPRYLTAEPDLKRFIQSIRMVISVFNTTSIEKSKFELDDTPLPPCDKFIFNSDQYWICLVRQFGLSLYHLVGTCKMGPKEDSKAVVDPRLRVYGIKRLRIVDASVIANLPKGNTNAPVIMYAEKGSEMIKEDWLSK